MKHDPPPGQRRPPALRLVAGGRGAAPTRVLVADEAAPPFEPDATVIEQDTDLLLAPPAAVIEEPPEHVGRLLLRVLNQHANPPGSIVVNETRPLRVHLVVHDLDEDPSWREAWIETALEALFETVRERRIQRLAMPLPGTVHGDIGNERALTLTLAALAHADDWQGRVWLRVATAEVDAVRALLRRLG